MKSLFAIVLAVVLCAASAAHAQPMACDGQGDSSQRAESGRYTVRFRFDPQPVVGQHFALLFAVCGRAAPAAPESAGVDARMPAHGHGMNYRPSVTALGGGRFRAEGLMLHMPGRWELVFVVQEAGSAERIVYPLDIQ